MSISLAPLLGRADVAAARGEAVAEARSSTLTNLQLLRATAAVAVLLFHASFYVERATGDGSFLRILDSRLGVTGVAVFFAISGYLMARLVRSTEPWRFLAHRVLRIFPAYLALAALFGLLAPQVRAIGLQLISLTLAPAGTRPYPLGIEWTLVCETTFYVVLFGLALMRFTRWLELIAAGWLLAILLVWLAAPDLAGGRFLMPAQLILLSPANAAFAGGLLLPWLLQRGVVPPVLLALALPLALLASPVGIDAQRWIGAVVGVATVGAALQMRQVPERSWPSRALVRLGDASYVIYLVHVPVITTVLAQAPAYWPPAALWCLSVALALGLSVLIGPVEVALYRRLRAWADAASPASLRRFGAAYLAIFTVAAAVGSTQVTLEERRAARIERSFAALPPAAFRSPEDAAAAIAARGRAIPGRVQGVIDGIAVSADRQLILKGWVFAAAAPRAQLHLGAFCGSRLIGLQRAIRLRPDILRGLGPGAAAASRIGVVMLLRPEGCAPGEPILAIAADSDGRLAVLPQTAALPAGGLPLP